MEINIEEYYRRYAPMVLRRCRQLLENEEEATDAMQEVFTRLLLHKKRLKDMYPSSLLFRIATNICLNIKRAKQSYQSQNKEAILSHIASYNESEHRVIMKDMLERVFLKKQKSTQEIAVLHFVDGMTLEEVADEVGLSVSGVRKRLRNLQEWIKKNKENYHGE